MKLFISTSIVGLLAISAAAGVMPEEISSTAKLVAETTEVTSVAGGSEIQEQPYFQRTVRRFDSICIHRIIYSFVKYFSIFFELAKGLFK